MAEKTTSTANDEVKETALRIFSQMPSQTNYSPEMQATEAYRRAEAFHAVSARVASGQLKPGESRTDSVLSDACAPNLPPDHPLNMISRSMGSVEKREQLIHRLRKPTEHGVTEKDDRPGYNRLYLESVTGVKSEDLVRAN